MPIFHGDIQRNGRIQSADYFDGEA